LGRSGALQSPARFLSGTIFAAMIRIAEAPKRLLVYRACEQMDTARSGKIEVPAYGSKYVQPAAL
jgi:hypothetical protein